MRLGVIADIHGVAGALSAVLGDGERLGVERWWVLGDLVLFGPHPVEVLEVLAELDDVAFVAGTPTGTADRRPTAPPCDT
ncbi:MAG TPA: metallophosphoesterase [Ilumatobacteraceae bacterium]|nr:metallophosphoesterase [Ilumatobacteraceae bacterium]